MSAGLIMRYALAVGALREIADADFRGNRSPESVVAFNALAALEEMERLDTARASRSEAEGALTQDSAAPETREETEA